MILATKPDRDEFDVANFTHHGKVHDTGSEAYQLDFSCGCSLLWLSETEELYPVAYLQGCDGRDQQMYEFSRAQSKTRSSALKATFRKLEREGHLAGEG